jgi:phosphocarrier protein HPr
VRLTRDVAIVNALGLHARAAARFVQMAGRFQAQIRLTRAGQTVDGKSIMGILLLAAARGAVVTIEAHGPDAAAAVDELAALVAAGFGEGM